MTTRTLRLVAQAPDWPVRFAVESVSLAAAMALERPRIEHVGSTAVTGLPGKPVLDVAIAVETEEEADGCVRPFGLLGYEYRGPHGEDPRRRYYVRDTDGRRAVQIHLYVMPATAWDEMLAFRDVLRGDPVLAAAYAAEKWRVAEAVEWDKRAYSEAKGRFVQQVLAALRASGDLATQDTIPE